MLGGCNLCSQQAPPKICTLKYSQPLHIAIVTTPPPAPTASVPPLHAPNPPVPWCPLPSALSPPQTQPCPNRPSAHCTAPLKSSPTAPPELDPCCSPCTPKPSVPAPNGRHCTPPNRPGCPLHCTPNAPPKPPWPPLHPLNCPGALPVAHTHTPPPAAGAAQCPEPPGCSQAGPEHGEGAGQAGGSEQRQRGHAGPPHRRQRGAGAVLAAAGRGGTHYRGGTGRGTGRGPRRQPAGCPVAPRRAAPTPPRWVGSSHGAPQAAPHGGEGRRAHTTTPHLRCPVSPVQGAHLPRTLHP